MVSIAIVGYNKMGQQIHMIAKEVGINVVSIIDPESEDATHKEITKESLTGVDVAIEFSTPKRVFENVRKISDLGVNIVLGTSGWYDRKAEIEEIILENNTGLIWSGNFSIGVNLFFRIIDAASKIINKIPEYDALIQSVHYNQKIDSPSGTALMLGNILLDNLDRKTEMVTEKSSGRTKENELLISASNVGHVPSIQTVFFDSPNDSIKLEYIARNRTGFAAGALMAANFIKGKKGFFEINDLMDDIIGKL